MTESTSDLVQCVIADGVALLTLNRPDRANAWTAGLHRAWDARLAELADNDDVRAVVVTGAGRAFCAGADMDELQSAARSDGSELDTGGASSRGLLTSMFFPKPVVAAVNGACAGLGLQIALMCDVRIASASAKFTTAFARRGLIAEHGLSWLLPRLTSLATALELLMSARVFLGDEAARLGVVHRAVPNDDVLDAAMEYARDLAANVSPTAMAVIKWQMYHHDALDLWTSIDHSDQLMVESILRSDLQEGVASFLERRSPEFAPLDPAAVPPQDGAFDTSGVRQLS